MLNYLGTIALAQAEYAQARRLCEQSLAIFREVSHTGGIAQALRYLGELAAAQGNAAEARALLEESLTLSRRLGDKPAIAGCLNTLGHIALCQGSVMESLELHRESLVLFRDLGNSVAITRVLEGLASVAVTQIQPVRAARLWGAAERLREAAGTPMSRHERSDYECNLAACRTQLDADTFAIAWQVGRTMTIEETIMEAFALDSLIPLEHRSHFLHPQGHQD
jgi:tetratricopeptide (TPR) repeat protein